MGIIKGIVALWRIASWLRSEKKAMEADIDGYLTHERAKELRLNLEKIFYALDTGSPFLKKLKGIPRPIQWFFDQTTADNRVGKFGQWVLDSDKLATGDKALNKPIKPYRAH